MMMLLTISFPCPLAIPPVASMFAISAMTVVITTSPWCTKLLGNLDEVKDDSDKGFCLAILNGLDVEEKFDFEGYWHSNGGDTITTSYGVYMVDTGAIAHLIEELAAY